MQLFDDLYKLTAIIRDGGDVGTSTNGNKITDLYHALMEKGSRGEHNHHQSSITVDADGAMSAETNVVDILSTTSITTTTLVSLQAYMHVCTRVASNQENPLLRKAFPVRENDSLDLISTFKSEILSYVAQFCTVRHVQGENEVS